MPATAAPTLPQASRRAPSHVCVDYHLPVARAAYMHPPHRSPSDGSPAVSQLRSVIRVWHATPGRHVTHAGTPPRGALMPHLSPSPPCCCCVRSMPVWPRPMGGATRGEDVRIRALSTLSAGDPMPPSPAELAFVSQGRSNNNKSTWCKKRNSGGTTPALRCHNSVV